MKRVIFAVAVLIAATAAFASDFVNMNNVSFYRVNLANPRKTVKAVGGPVAFQALGACEIFINSTTAARVAAGTGYPMATGTTAQFNYPRTTDLTFTCATTVNRGMYVVR